MAITTTVTPPVIINNISSLIAYTISTGKKPDPDVIKRVLGNNSKDDPIFKAMAILQDVVGSKHIAQMLASDRGALALRCIFDEMNKAHS